MSSSLSRGLLSEKLGNYEFNRTSGVIFSDLLRAFIASLCPVALVRLVPQVCPSLWLFPLSSPGLSSAQLRGEILDLGTTVT